MNPLIVFFVATLLLKTVTQLLLDWVNLRHLSLHEGKVPKAFKSFITKKEYDKSVSYTKAKTHFGMCELVYDSIILAIVVLSGLLPWLYYGFTSRLGMSLWGQSAVLCIIMLALSVPSLPFEWYSQFRLEERFGFNKSTFQLWISDKIKGMVLGVVIAYPLLCAFLYFFQTFEQTWWIWAFVAFFSVQLLMMLLYPRLILPLFNKLAPLEKGPLRKRLLALAKRTGFKTANIEVMDGSKRSSHSNAFFTGFGKFRHIVLYDTLMEQLEDDEVEAVLAHEIGHYKKGHIPKMLFLSALLTFLGFAGIGWLVTQAWFFHSLGFSVASGMVPALLLFSLLIGLITFWLKPFTNAWSRKHEYEADAFARNAVGNNPEPLITSLRKLHQKNLSNLTPHPLYSQFYYSHPTLLEREASLNEQA